MSSLQKYMCNEVLYHQVHSFKNLLFLNACENTNYSSSNSNLEAQFKLLFIHVSILHIKVFVKRILT